MSATLHAVLAAIARVGVTQQPVIYLLTLTLFLWAGAVLLKLLLKKQRRATDKPSYRQSLSQVMRYEEHCERSLLMEPYPMTYGTVGSYLIAYVIKNGGSAKSLGNVRSQLKTVGRRRGNKWLNPADAGMIRKLVSELQYEDCMAQQRMKPLTTMMIIRVLRKLNTDQEVELMEARLFALAAAVEH
jgi:hypothetical protein